VQAGFSTIEVLIALVVFALGVVAVAGGAGALVRLDGDTWKRLEAVAAAQRRLEAARLACPDSGRGLVIVVAVSQRAGRPPVVDTLATEVACA
jgi:prepilin-type N-terminal cleavage/methylation domain-containing protein